jgi:hypothetical protein
MKARSSSASGRRDKRFARQASGAAGVAAADSHERGRCRGGESGYALLLALFMIAAMVIASTAVFTDARTQGRREREEQMVWRGNQFVRAIRLYYRRAGHYPQNLDELQSGLADIHFIRPEALKDPMNTDEDAQWRFIYTNASGQIVGSVRYATIQQMALLDLYSAQIAAMQKANSESGDSSAQDDSGQDNSSQGSSGPGNSGPGTAAGVTSTGACAPGASSSAQPGIGQSITGPSQLLGPAPAPTNAPGVGSATGFSLGSGSDTSAGSSSQNQGTCMPQVPGMPGLTPATLQALLELKPTGPVDSPVIGGFLVGVGSTVDRTSVRIYNGGKKYNQWEFIYNPIEEQARAVQQGMTMAGSVGLLGAPGNGLPGPATTTTGGIGSSPIQAAPAQPQPDQNQ